MKQGRKRGLRDNYLPPIFSLILTLYNLFANGQAVYNPSYTPLFTVSNKPYAMAQAGPDGGRSYKADSINFIWRPFNGVSEVLTYFPVSIPKYRTGQFPIEVNIGGALQSNGTFIGGQIYEYWWRNGTADSQLVLKAPINTTCTGCLLSANNLSDVANASLSLQNLGAGNMATQNIIAGGDLSGNWPNPTVAKFNGQLPSFYLNYNNLNNTPPGVSLTTIGTSGPSSFNPTTGVLNIPNYATGGGGACLNCNADSLQGLPVDITDSLRNNYCLVIDTINGKFKLGPCGTGGAGLNQLTQDVLVGPGTGSQPATVVGIRAVGIPTLSSGNLRYTGTSFIWDATAYLTGGSGLSPLFTNNTSGNTLTFALNNVSAYSAFGNFTNATATPSFSKIPYQAFATNSPNLLLGWDGSGNPSPISLTTTGSSGPATLSGSVLNIPQYSGGGGGITQLFSKNDAIGILGTDTVKMDTTKYSRIFNITSPKYGAKGDGKRILDGVATNGSTTYTSASANFTSADAGKAIRLWLAGPGKKDLVTTIASVTNSTTVVLANAPSTTISVDTAVYGTDNTAAIQAALNDADASGGGKVWIPTGVFIVAGALQTSVGGTNPNCQIYIPVSTFINSSIFFRKHFIIEGETPPEYIPNLFAQSVTPLTGSIIYSIINGSGSLPSVIGTKSNDPANNNINFNFVTFKNLTVITPQDIFNGGTSIGGINMYYAAADPMNNVMVCVDGSIARSVQPTNEVAGIITNELGAEIETTLDNVFSSQYKYAFIFGDAVEGIRTYAFLSHYGYVIASNEETIHFNYASSYWNNVSVYVPATTIGGYIPANTLTSHFDFDLLMGEWFSGSGNWYDYTYIVSDTANLGVGDIHYDIAHAGHTWDNALYNQFNGTGIKACAIGQNCIVTAGTPAVGGTNAIQRDSVVGGVHFFAGDVNQFSWDPSTSRLIINGNQATDVRLNLINSNSAGQAEFQAINNGNMLVGNRIKGSTAGAYGDFAANTGSLFSTATGGLAIFLDAAANITFSAGNGAPAQERGVISGTTGQWRFDNYGVLAFLGTPTSCAAFDASGNIIEVPCGGGGPGGVATSIQINNGVGGFSGFGLYDSVNKWVAIGANAPLPFTDLSVTHNYAGFTGINVQNTNSGGQAGFQAQSDVAGASGIRVRGSTLGNFGSWLQGTGAIFSNVNGDFHFINNSAHGLVFSTGSGTPVDQLIIGNSGQLQLTQYVSTSSFPGTAVGLLGFDASGNILTVTTGGGGAVSSVSNSDGTLTISPTTGSVVASLALAHANTWSGVQTQPAPIFTGMTSAGVNDSILTINPSTGQVRWKSGSLNIVAANGIQPGVSGDSLILGGSLNQNTTINTGNFIFSIYNGSTGKAVYQINKQNGTTQAFAIGRDFGGVDGQDFYIYDYVAGIERISITSAGKVVIPNTLQIADGTQGAGKVFTSDASGNGSWQTGSGANIYNSDGTISTTSRTVTIPTSGTLLFTGGSSGNFNVNIGGIQLTANSTVVGTTGGTVSLGTDLLYPGWNVTTSGSTLAPTQSNSAYLIDPASTLSSLTITLPTLSSDGQVFTFNFGGTLTSGTIVTTLSIGVASGSTLVQNSAPTTAVFGDYIAYKYYINGSTKRWYRIH